MAPQDLWLVGAVVLGIFAITGVLSARADTRPIWPAVGLGLGSLGAAVMGLRAAGGMAGPEDLAMSFIRVIAQVVN